MSKVTVRLSDAEWTVMNVLWTRSPASARDVLEAVASQTRWAYTTVCTILSRLASKGAVQMRKQKNAFIYEPRISQDEARRSAVRGLLDRAFGGTISPLVQHLFVEEKLSKKDRDRLTSLIEDLEKPRRKR